MDGTVSLQWNNLKQKPYVLNFTKALEKKLFQCERVDFEVQNKSGNVVISFNSGAYELVRSLLSDFYHHHPNLFVEITEISRQI